MARDRPRALLILGYPILGAILMGGLLGKHWGYSGRMPYFAFPLALALLALLFSSWVNATESKAPGCRRGWIVRCPRSACR